LAVVEEERMSHPLNGCLLKLDRASVHLAALGTAIGDVAGGAPDYLPGRLETPGGRYLFRTVRGRLVPLVLSALAGDVVHNLAAALDYMTWELAVAHTGEGDSRTAFPIFEKRAEYQQYAKRKIEHLHADARAEIERVQPFQVPCTVQHPR
jgi:hypothetical protein